MTVLRGLNDRLVAPHADTGELLATYGCALAGTLLAVALAVRGGLPALPMAVIAVVAFDFFGGAVVNATPAAKRRFHRPGRTRRHHLGFVAGHVHPFVLAAVIPGFAWGAAAVIYGLALAGALAVLAVPLELRRPVAFAACVLGSAVALTVVPVPAALAWLAPVLLIKVLLGHLLPEEASR